MSADLYQCDRCGQLFPIEEMSDDMCSGCNRNIPSANTFSTPVINERDYIHDWFELSYAQYLTIPRSILQSMDEGWQATFVQLLEELDRTFDWRPKKGRYWVRLKDEKGRFVPDELMDYERGRRKIPKDFKRE